MKNKKIIIVLTLSALAIVILLLGINVIKNTVNMDFTQTGEVVFIYDDVNASSVISEGELSSIKSMFDGKRMYKDNLSCGFTEDISIKFNDSQTFCFARDACPIIYWKEEDKFFKITEEEKKQLYDILDEYGFSFPCV